ncbi:MAG: bacillopeptidase-like protein, partial [bacterium]
GGAAPFVFQVGTDTEPPAIVHTPLDDQPVSDDSRPVPALVTDNLDHGLRLVRLVHRRNAGDSTAVDLTGPAPNFRGFLPTTGLTVGDTFDYRIEAADSAMAPNIGRSPLDGWHQFRIVAGFGLIPPSGQKVWGTELTGAYHDNLASTLEFAPVDLSGFTSGTLSFQHHLDCEFFYDGGIIESSSDGGTTWQPMTPDGGYTIPHVEASNLPGFSGSFDGWRAVEADLSMWAGNPAFRVRLRFFSDTGVTGPGWYIDDLKIVDRRARLRPDRPMADSDPDGNVMVAWLPPPGYEEAPSGPVTGYHVYRATLSGSEPVRLTGEPITMRSFEDSGLPDGASWDYFVTALYASGESRLAGPATASRVQPIYAGDWSVMEAEVDSGAVLDTVLVVGNAGTGDLRVNSYAARAGQDLDDVRIKMSLVEFGAAWDTLFIDPSESDTLEADIRLIEVRQTADSLLYRLTAWRPWSDPLVDFSLAVELDRDDDITTGPRGELFGLIGARALALVGAPQGLFEHTGGSSYIHAGSLLTWSAAGGGQSAIIGFDKTGGQAPPVVRVVARVYAGASSLTEDRAPDVVTLPWLTLGTRHMEISAGQSGGQSGNLLFRLGGASVPPGLVDGTIVLETSDPVNPGVALPVALQVSSTVSAVLGRFTATPVPTGLELAWTTVEALDHLGFRLARRGVSPVATDEVMIGPELIRADGDGSTWRFLDADVRPGFQYEYRLAAVSRGGRIEWHGPFAVTMPGALIPVSMQLAPAVPNPAPGATT